MSAAVVRAKAARQQQSMLKSAALPFAMAHTTDMLSLNPTCRIPKRRWSLTSRRSHKMKAEPSRRWMAAEVLQRPDSLVPQSASRSCVVLTSSNLESRPSNSAAASLSSMLSPSARSRGFIRAARGPRKRARSDRRPTRLTSGSGQAASVTPKPHGDASTAPTVVLHSRVMLA